MRLKAFCYSFAETKYCTSTEEIDTVRFIAFIVSFWNMEKSRDGDSATSAITIQLYSIIHFSVSHRHKRWHDSWFQWTYPPPPHPLPNDTHLTPHLRTLIRWPIAISQHPSSRDHCLDQRVRTRVVWRHARKNTELGHGEIGLFFSPCWRFERDDVCLING